MLSHFSRMASTSCGMRNQVLGGFGMRLVMVEESMGRVKDPVSLVADLETQVDVVEGDRELGFVEATHFPEDIGTGHQAGAGYSAHVANYVGKVEVVARAAVQGLKGMAAVVIDPHDHASMLDTAIGIQQLGSNCAYFGPHSEFDHRFEPSRLDHRSIVIEKQ